MLELGKKLKSLRVKSGLTQEQLSEALGVSSQAVSRWENNATYPDITLLPVIARYFDVTADELLGVDIERNQQEIDSVIDYNCQLHYKGEIDESIAFLREKIRQYPRNANITYQLAFSLHKKSNTMISGSSEQIEMINEVIELCEKALKLDEGKSFVTGGSRQILCFSYKNLGLEEKAIEAAENMPTIWVSKEVLLAHVYDSEDELKLRQHNLLTFLDLSILNLHHLSRKMKTAEESIVLLKKAAKLADILTGDDHKFYNERVFVCYLWIAKAYCSIGKKDEAFENLELALKYAVMYEERPEESKYNVFWLSEVTDCKAKTSKNYSWTLYVELLEKISEESFALLHGTEEYKAFTDKVRKYISK